LKRSGITFLRATLVDVVEKRNVTLSLPEDLLTKFRVLAATRNVSMSSLMESAITKLVTDADDTELRTKRMVERMRNSTVRGPGDNIPWTRDEIYDRVR
jgi:hypothetical protein